MSVIETRAYQLFPVLDPGQIETAKRVASGPVRDFAPGAIVFDVGERNIPIWLLLKGAIEVMRRDGLQRESTITTLGVGQFTGEVSQLAGQETLAFARAGAEGCTALPFDAAHVRALLIGSAEIGEVMMRAFILRRVGLIEGARRRVSACRTAGLSGSRSVPGVPGPERLSLYDARCRNQRRPGVGGA